MNDWDVAEDLAAQTFLKALEAQRDAKGPTSHLSGWLYRIAHNLVIDYYRERDRHATIDLDELTPFASHDARPDEIAEQHELGWQLERATRRMTDKQLRVFRMRWEGYRYGEIAQAMESNEGTAKALWRRAVVNVRTLTKNNHERKEGNGTASSERL